ncbi:MAG: response regulator transcription factor [Chloroflexi bacterium]|nr:response regulator transcription factor [Chloroflexota bacterium]
MQSKIRIAILDDHPIIVEGYLAKLGKDPQIEVTATMSVADLLEPVLQKGEVDVLILDVSVPTSAENRNPYPILHVIPTLLEEHPNLNILVISMRAERGLIREVMAAGANGYILKDDQNANAKLAGIIKSVAEGGVYLSEEANNLYVKHLDNENGKQLSPRQLEALSLCAAFPGEKSVVLAKKMHITHSAYRTLLSGAYIKLGARTRADAIAKARQMGLITPDQD